MSGDILEGIAATLQEVGQIARQDIAFNHRVAEEKVGPLPDFDDPGFLVRITASAQHRPAQFVLTKATGGLGEAWQFGGVIQAIEGMRGIAPEHHRIGQIEGKHAAREPMLYPGRCHTDRLTFKCRLTS